MLISDTVGFISKLPHHLVEAFKATLEELEYADLLLHVIDASNPRWPEQAAVVDALIVQNPFEIGYQGVKLALRKLAGETLERTCNVPSMIVDKSNLEEMKQRFPSALGL